MNQRTLPDSNIPDTPLVQVPLTPQEARNVLAVVFTYQVYLLWEVPDSAAREACMQIMHAVQERAWRLVHAREEDASPPGEQALFSLTQRELRAFEEALRTVGRLLRRPCTDEAEQGTCAEARGRLKAFRKRWRELTEER